MYKSSNTISLEMLLCRTALVTESQKNSPLTYLTNRSCSASHSAYCYTFLHSVVCLSVICLSHLCPLLKLLDWFRCHLAGTLVGSNGTF